MALSAVESARKLFNSIEEAYLSDQEYIAALERLGDAEREWNDVGPLYSEEEKAGIYTTLEECRTEAERLRVERDK